MNSLKDALTKLGLLKDDLVNMADLIIIVAIVLLLALLR
jgi:hypothetical protein